MNKYLEKIAEKISDNDAPDWAKGFTGGMIGGTIANLVGTPVVHHYFKKLKDTTLSNESHSDFRYYKKNDER